VQQAHGRRCRCMVRLRLLRCVGSVGQEDTVDLSCIRERSSSLEGCEMVSDEQKTRPITDCGGASSNDRGLMTCGAAGCCACAPSPADNISAAAAAGAPLAEYESAGKHMAAAAAMAAGTAAAAAMRPEG
jgi:hypothetical protein